MGAVGGHAGDVVFGTSYDGAYGSVGEQEVGCCHGGKGGEAAGVLVSGAALDGSAGRAFVVAGFAGLAWLPFWFGMMGAFVFGEGCEGWEAGASRLGC